MEQDISSYLKTHVRNSTVLIFNSEIFGEQHFLKELFDLLQKTDSNKIRINVIDDIDIKQRLPTVDKFPILIYDLTKAIPKDIDQKLAYRMPNAFYREKQNTDSNDHPVNKQKVNFQYIYHDLFSIHGKVEIIGENDDWWILSYADLEWFIVGFSIKNEDIFMNYFIDNINLERHRYKSLKSVISQSPAFIGNPNKRKQFSNSIEDIFSNSFYEL